jgi:Protein of unknown function (DUF3501)
MNAHTITRADIMPMDAYAKARGESRKRITQMKEHRRVAVGPFAMFYFENRDTMLHQIHEMLYIEKGGENQIAEEIEAYSPLVPNGRELVATMMLEIEDAAMRARELLKLGYIEDKVSIVVESGSERAVVKAVPEDDEERTTPDGKTSSVHFFHFPFDAAAVALFKKADSRVVIAIDHANYGHMAVLPAPVKAALAADFD